MLFNFTEHHTVKNDLYHHSIVKKLMLQRTYLLLCFGYDRNKRPCIFIEAEHVKRFPYYPNRATLTWLMKYLFLGNSEDFGVNPEEMNIPHPETIESEIFLHLLRENVQLAYNPLIRETSGKIEALAHCPNGCIQFAIPRTAECISTLKQFNQPINLLIG